MAQKERLARLCLAFATRKPIMFGFAEGVRVSLFEELASSVLVFQVFPSCGAQRNLRAVRLLDFFDRCANSRSLFPPLAAVALIARAGTGARYGFHYQTIK